MADQEELDQFAQIARATAAVQMETLLSNKEEIIKLDFSAIEKLATLSKATAPKPTNGVCGLGCSEK